MFRSRLLTSLLFSIFGVLSIRPLPAMPGPVRHMHKHESKEEIATLENQWRDAIINADVSLMDKLLSDDYVGISITGQINTKQMQLDRLKSRTLQISRMDLSDLKVKLVGSVAIVTSSALVTGSNDGVDMHGTFRYTRVYQRSTAGIWKITNFEATRVPSPVEQISRRR